MDNFCADHATAPPRPGPGQDLLGNRREPRGGPCHRPGTLLHLPLRVLPPSRRWAERVFPDLRYWNELDKGGHFAALEQPVAFTGEVRAAFRAFR
jgi:pimeloyl-ACP methyl ester carboxylesterase